MSAPQTVPISEQAKQLLLRWFDEVWNQARRETIFELVSPDAVIHDGSEVIRGPEGFASFYDNLRAQFSEFRITPIIALAEGNLASVHWSAVFRQTSTGKSLAINGTSVVRVVDGQFVEGWQNWDVAHLAKQLAS